MTRRLALLTGAAVMAAAIGSAYVHAQDTSAGQGPGMGRRGGPGGPGGFGGPGRLGGPGGPGGLLGPMMRHLDLTDAQREQVKSVVDSHRDDMKALADRGFAARTALQAAIQTEPFDEGAVRARSADVAAVDADMAVLQARIHGELWRLLTPEQQKTAQTLQTQMAQRRAAARAGRGGPGGRRGGPR